jgi:hypothetical protein
VIGACYPQRKKTIERAHGISDLLRDGGCGTRTWRSVLVGATELNREVAGDGRPRLSACWKSVHNIPSIRDAPTNASGVNLVLLSTLQILAGIVLVGTPLAGPGSRRPHDVMRRFSGGGPR